MAKLLKVFALPLILALVTSKALTSELEVVLAEPFCAATNGGPFHVLGTVLGRRLCAIAILFKTSLLDPNGRLILAVFLAFIAAFIVILYIESVRVTNKNHPIIRYPVPHLVITALFGAYIDIPLLLCPAFLYKTLHERETSAAQSGHQARGSEQLAGQRLLSTVEIYSIPIAVLFGFIIPTIAMLFMYSDNVTYLGVWQFFAVFVAVFRYASNTILSFAFPQLPSDSVRFETSIRALALVYGLPCAASILAHIAYIYQTFIAPTPLPLAMASPIAAHAVLRVLVMDFWAMTLGLIYWLWFEGGLKAIAWAIGVGVIAGPGAGLCAGWIVREERMCASKTFRRTTADSGLALLHTATDVVVQAILKCRWTRVAMEPVVRWAIRFTVVGCSGAI